MSEQPSLFDAHALNPRFVLFARSRGRIPEKTRAGWEFINWIRTRWNEWDKLVGHNGISHTEADHEAFDAWLARWCRGES